MSTATYICITNIEGLNQLFFPGNKRKEEILLKVLKTENENQLSI